MMANGEKAISAERLSELRGWLNKQLVRSLKAFYRAGTKHGAEEEIDNIEKKVDTYNDLITIIDRELKEAGNDEWRN